MTSKVKDITLLTILMAADLIDNTIHTWLLWQDLQLSLGTEPYSRGSKLIRNIANNFLS